MIAIIMIIITLERHTIATETKYPKSAGQDNEDINTDFKIMVTSQEYRHNIFLWKN